MLRVGELSASGVSMRLFPLAAMTRPFPYQVWHVTNAMPLLSGCQAGTRQCASILQDGTACG